MILLDSHCHLDAPMSADDIAATLDRARAVGLVAAITIGGGDGLDYARHAVSVAEAHADVFATVAVHPHDAKVVDDAVFDALRALCDHPKVVGVGETGLDFHYDHSPRDVQIAVFRRFIGLAREVGLPLSLHIREAHDEALAVAAEEGAGGVGGVVHCFTAGPDEAGRWLDLGFHLSIPGVVTFKNAAALREAVPLIPDDRLLIETDSPYLAPIPKRGRRNEPAYLAHTAAKVAELRGTTTEAVGLLTAQNTVRLFGLPASLLQRSA